MLGSEKKAKLNLLMELHISSNLPLYKGKWFAILPGTGRYSSFDVVEQNLNTTYKNSTICCLLIYNRFVKT